MNYWWIIAVILINIWAAFTTEKVNSTHSSFWFCASWSVAFLPLWPVVSNYSKSLIFDGILFDVLMVVTYTIAIIIFTKSFETLKIHNYLGLLIVVFGLFLIKYK